MPDNVVALRAFVAVGVYARFMRVNSIGFRFGTANRAFRAFVLRCSHIASSRLMRGRHTLSCQKPPITGLGDGRDYGPKVIINLPEIAPHFGG